MPLGKYEYLKVPFGSDQAPTCFQNLMNKVLNGQHFSLAYLDDVTIFSESVEHHLKHIQIVLTRLKQAKLRLKKSKCLFFKQELHYPGHLLMTKGIKPQSEKIKAISQMKLPKNQKGVREFLGMVTCYQKFINRFPDATRPMTKLTRKGVKFEWTDECQIGFDYLKTCLTEAPILKYPDPSKRYVVSQMPQIRLQQPFLHKNILLRMERPRKCQLPTFPHSSVILSLNGVLLSRKGMLSTMQ